MVSCTGEAEIAQMLACHTRTSLKPGLTWLTFPLRTPRCTAVLDWMQLMEVPHTSAVTIKLIAKPCQGPGNSNL